MSEIRIDEHTVAGCPCCHSTKLETKSYFNHLSNRNVEMCMCKDCGMIFEPEEIVRISELPETEEIKELKNRIGNLEKRVESLTEIVRKSYLSNNFICDEKKSVFDIVKGEPIND